MRHEGVTSERLNALLCVRHLLCPRIQLRRSSGLYAQHLFPPEELALSCALTKFLPAPRIAMLFFLTPSTVSNASATVLRRVPRQTLDRGIPIWPRGSLRSKVFWRLTFEHVLTRYTLAVLPFPALLLAYPDMALPISQAPLAMFAAVYFVETRYFAISDPQDRKALLTEAQVARGLDQLAARGRKVLTRLAAARGLQDGALHLVVEQSALARIAPFTLISVQQAGETPAFVDLTEEERAESAATLFDEAFSERDLQRLNLCQNQFLREVVLDARSLSAHARLAGLAAQRKSG